MIPFLLSPVGRWLAGLGALLAVFLVLWLYVGHLKHEATVANALAASQALEIEGLRAQAKQAAATTKIDTATAKAEAKTAATTSTNLERVKLYVPPAADSRCIVGSNAVRLLNLAALDQTVPIPASGLQDADSSVPLSELVADGVANAGTYHTLAERLKAWDDWYDAQAAIAR